MSTKMTRRTFMKASGVFAATTTLPFGLVEVAWGQNKADKFTFAYISDTHITHIKGSTFVNNFDNGLKKAVFEANFMTPKPDFVVFGGDLAQLGKKEEIDHGLEIMSDLNVPVKWVIGEHDYYLDLGEYWQEKIGPLHYSFDHKGVHFVVLNSILTDDDWTHNKWSTPEERMLQMARLDNPEGSPFMVKAEQRDWLKKDLESLDPQTPIIVLSHSPLYKIFKAWNFWTEDAEEVHAILAPFKSVTVLHGHVHQIIYHQMGNITFNAFMATAWPWPYPSTYSQLPSMMPTITVPMNRADPFKERDGTGWGHVQYNGGVEIHNQLWENDARIVEKKPSMEHPEDTQYQEPSKRIPPQQHY
ncbi:MAG: metallophosphoesterase [Pseudomonadota bacterium]|nr:metallophosphoesterase [Pseudomonadota bacterium]